MTRLSPSTLNLFLECPKCFWLKQKMNIHRPQGPFPSLPGGMDGLIKKYFDRYRLLGKLPPELEGKVDGAELFPDIEALNKWRNWRTGLSYIDEETGAELGGALDELMIKDGKYIATDYKTRGYDVKEGGEAFYQNQLNCYSLMLTKNNLPDAGYAWLVYWIPKEVNEGGMVKFMVDLKKVKTSAEEALRVFRSAVNLLEEPMPQSHSNCSFCSWGADFLSD